MQPLLTPSGISRLRAALGSARYTSTGITERLGDGAAAHARRGDLRAALRRTTSRDPLDTLIRLFVCGQNESPATAELAFAPLPLVDAIGAGLVELVSVDGAVAVRAAVELEPYGDHWVLSDISASLRPGQALRKDHVLGVGAASTTLADATIRQPVRTALDLGTGCGVQALHLSDHADRVTATDLSERALRFAATTAALNGLDWELLLGDMTEPVSGRRFDLIVSNPPFVVGPGTATHTYRDSGRAGDAVCSQLAAAARDLLNDGGTMQFLANWLHVSGQPWQERVANWITDTGLDAWIIQRDVSDPGDYVDLWLSDASEDLETRPARAAAWLDWFDANHVEGVGFGLVTLRAGGHATPTVRVEELRQQLPSTLGPQIDAWFVRQGWLRSQQGDRMLTQRLRVTEGLRLHQDAAFSDGVWDVQRQTLTTTQGVCWTQDVDPVTLALVAGCDGNLSLGDQLELLSTAHQVEKSLLTDVALPIVERLVERGILIPV